MGEKEDLDPCGVVRYCGPREVYTESFGGVRPSKADRTQILCLHVFQAIGLDDGGCDFGIGFLGSVHTIPL